MKNKIYLATLIIIISLILGYLNKNETLVFSIYENYFVITYFTISIYIIYLTVLYIFVCFFIFKLKNRRRV